MEDIGAVPIPGQSIFSVEGARAQSRDEAELIKQAKKQLQLHKQATQKMSRLEKGAIADRVLHSGHGEASFAHRLGALLRLSGKPMNTVTVEYRNLRIEADALVGSAGNPSVLNSAKDALRLVTFQRPPTVPHTILDGVSGVLKPGRMTLLLGPPSGGKSVLLQALSGRLRSGRNLRISGSIKYNGMELHEFQPRRTAGLVKQQDNHLSELTVAETVDFSFRCLVGPQQRTEIYSRTEAARRLLKQQREQCCEDAAQLAEAEGGMGMNGGHQQQELGAAAANGSSHPADAGSDSYSATNGSDSAAASSGTGGGEQQAHSPRHLGCTELVADEEFAAAMSEVVGKRLAPYITIRIMGLAHTAQTQVGSSEVRGISGGERKRLTTAEILVGQQPVVFMDEISTGLDSATAYSVVRTFRSVVHNLQRTFLISLLQPAPEIIDLFDDLLLLTDGRVIYHGPVKGMLAHFRSLGFVCPTRKDPGSFLQEVTTPTGQWLYASPDLLQKHGLAEEDRAPQALLAAPPSELLMGVEDMQHAFWEGTGQGRGMLHQVRGFEVTALLLGAVERKVMLC
jgi:ABC-type multidrug transport system ATPase subunit